MQNSQNMYDVIVVGAGLSGLIAAQILLKQEKRVLVIQSSNVAGGIIKNYTIGQTMQFFNKKSPWLEDAEAIQKTYIETGASEILSSHTFMIKLAEQFDMTLFPYYQDGKFLYFQKQDTIKKVNSLIDIYLCQEHQKTILRLIAKIQNLSKNIKEAHDNMINNPSKKYYRNVLSQYIEFYDKMTVKDFFQKEVPKESLRKMVINEFEIVESISVDKISILQVFFHGYGLQNLKKFTNKKTFFDETLRMKEGMSCLIEKLEQKIKKRGGKLGIKNPIRYSEPVLEIKNEINSEVQIITNQKTYKCFKVFFTASIGKANQITISKLSSAKRVIFESQQSEQVQKIFLIFESAFWRAKYSGSGVFSQEFPFSQINDVSPSNLSCGILCFVLCGKKPIQWAEKFEHISQKQEKYIAMEKYLKQLVANAYLNGNVQDGNLQKMVMIPASLKDNSGYQTYTKKGVCLKLDKSSEDYLECYSRDEHNIIFLGSELSKKFASCMEGAVRYTREKIFKYLQIQDPWNIPH